VTAYAIGYGGVAVGSSVLHNMLFFALGLAPPSALPGNILAMTVGDFTGSLIAVALAVALLRLYRRGTARKKED